MSERAHSPLLDAIESPAQLRALPESALEGLAAEMRTFLSRSAPARDGGAEELDGVELAIALHYVFETPEDRLVWDAGAHACAHKVLTGRRARLHTIRQPAGLAPFPVRAESPFDAFGAGHSSTSIGAALGMAVAAARQGSARRAVAVTGDGAMRAGMAFEALNHAGSLPVDLLVVLNDGDAARSRAVGPVSHSLARLIASPLYAQMRERGRRALRRLPAVRRLARRSEEHVKGMLLPGTLFEEMGFNYVGPIDGEDLGALLRVLRTLRSARGPQLLHLVRARRQNSRTEPLQHPPRWDGAGAAAWSEVFGEWLCSMAERDPRIVAVTPSPRESSGLARFARRFPERLFDVAIAEQHAVTLAAGLAAEGLRPVVAIDSTFLQRGYDQLIHDVALQRLPVLFAIDRAGFDGSDGATHHGSYDLSFLRCIPNLVVMAPADENECRRMLYSATCWDGPAAVRYPRAAVPGVAMVEELSALEPGCAQVRRHGAGGLALLSFGVMLAPALRLGERFDATVVNMRFVKPLDVALLRAMAASHLGFVTLEEGAIAGGAGSACGEALDAQGLMTPRLHIGIGDRITGHGSREQCLAAAGLDFESMASAIETWRDCLPALKSARAATRLTAGAGQP
jgi:1-deoxy-D-xylulose-5-phosphate synthase